MYKLVLKTEDLKFNINKRTILYDSLYSDNSIEYISYLVDNLEDNEVKVFEFTTKDVSLNFKGKNTIKISLRLNRHTVITKVKEYLKENSNKFIVLINPPLEILKEFKLNSKKYLIYVNQLPADDLLFDLKAPLLFIGRNFSNNEQSSFHNIKYYLYKNKIMNFFEKVFVFIFVISAIILIIYYLNGDMNNSIDVFLEEGKSFFDKTLEYIKSFFDKFLGNVKGS